VAAKTNSGPEIPSLKIGVGTERIQKQLVDSKSCSHYSSHRSSSETPARTSDFAKQAQK
jgi:hypothetical protein